MKEAMYYKKLDDNRVLCNLCPHNCNIKDGGKGVCRVRENISGVLYSLNYDRISAIAMDPIEKKPLYHFYPGSYILSAGSVGCNFKCSFCQNYSISQTDEAADEITPEDLVYTALSQKNNIGIAYTYNEPSIWYEFVYEASKLAREKGLKNVLVTNGFISEEPLKKLLPFIDALNIDVKAFTEKYYRDVCKGMLEPVKRTVMIASEKCHVEVTTLVVTDLNDSMDEIGQIAKWLSSINRDIPLHLSRYFPNYKLYNDPTPVNTLIAAKEEAEKYLNYVYIGNLWGYDSSTYCPNCKVAVVKRNDEISDNGISNGKCRFCGQKIYGRFNH
ncbi:MAG TPA: AmmeMemoRadiSam system radical SAM enzyme [Clostridiaceae bacterium]|nr:AmmeMemoRadiSam system radical SAM enzyme [Clostridiaceae bacterium]